MLGQNAVNQGRKSIKNERVRMRNLKQYQVITHQASNKKTLTEKK